MKIKAKTPIMYNHTRYEEGKEFEAGDRDAQRLINADKAEKVASTPLSMPPPTMTQSLVPPEPTITAAKRAKKVVEEEKSDDTGT